MDGIAPCGIKPAAVSRASFMSFAHRQIQAVPDSGLPGVVSTICNLNLLRPSGTEFSLPIISVLIDRASLA